MKRFRQAAYLGSHPFSHRTCANIIRHSRLPTDQLTELKYVGHHLALSLNASERRQVLARHYSVLPSMLLPGCVADLGHGLTIWQAANGKDLPDLSITLESAKLAPMEGELQLRFSFRSDLCVLTFSLAPGHVFKTAAPNVLFIGGVQGRTGSRAEVREASRLNGEIPPATMLILAVQSLARAMNVSELIAVGENEQIARLHASSKMVFDYARFWSKAGAVPVGRHYCLPFDTPQKPLSRVTPGHRSRAKRRRAIKAEIKKSIECGIRQIINPQLLAAPPDQQGSS